MIEKNTTGVNNFNGTIQFNRIARNDTGINATSGQKVFHNLIYRNTTNGLLISADSDVRVVSNTFYAPTGDNIHIQNASSNIEIRDNILWAETGYDVFVANDSQIGFFSDYNDLHITGAGKIFYWTRDFTDILDFQADVAAFDLHSIGRTVVNPNWSEPRFFNRPDDYRIFDLISGQPLPSPTVDAGDPITDQAPRSTPIFSPTALLKTASTIGPLALAAVPKPTPRPSTATTISSPTTSPRVAPNKPSI